MSAGRLITEEKVKTQHLVKTDKTLKPWRRDADPKAF
jgi:hypothetical protein